MNSISSNHSKKTEKNDPFRDENFKAKVNQARTTMLIMISNEVNKYIRSSSTLMNSKHPKDIEKTYSMSYSLENPMISSGTKYIELPKSSEKFKKNNTQTYSSPNREGNPDSQRNTKVKFRSSQTKTNQVNKSYRRLNNIQWNKVLYMPTRKVTLAFRKFEHDRNRMLKEGDFKSSGEEGEDWKNKSDKKRNSIYKIVLPANYSQTGNMEKSPSKLAGKNLKTSNLGRKQAISDNLQRNTGTADDFFDKKFPSCQLDERNFENIKTKNLVKVTSPQKSKLLCIDGKARVKKKTGSLASVVSGASNKSVQSFISDHVSPIVLKSLSPLGHQEPLVQSHSSELQKTSKKKPRIETEEEKKAKSIQQDFNFLNHKAQSLRISTESTDFKLVDSENIEYSEELFDMLDFKGVKFDSVFSVRNRDAKMANLIFENKSSLNKDVNIIVPTQTKESVLDVLHRKGTIETGRDDNLIEYLKNKNCNISLNILNKPKI